MAAAKSYMTVQFGLSIFEWSEDKYLSRTFNFTVFPQNSVSFSCSADALQFLSRSKFDLNLWVKEGVSWVTPGREAELAARRATFRAKDAASTRVAATDAEREAVAAALEAAANLAAAKPDPSVAAAEPSCKIPCSFGARGLVLAELRRAYPTAHVRAAPGRDEGALFTLYSTAEELEAVFVQEEAECRFRDRGFGAILDAMQASGKPVAGHNLLTDLAYTHQHFWAPLPATVEEFATSIHTLFPVLFDTKHVAATLPAVKALSADTVLGKLHKRLAPVGLEVAHAPGFDRYLQDASDADKESPFAHEAGYDAFMTGCCLARSLYVERCARAAAAAVSNTDAQDAALTDASAASVRSWPAAFGRVVGGEEHDAFGVFSSVAQRVFVMGYPSPLVLDGPQEPFDFSRFHVLSGFPASVQTAAVLGPMAEAFPGSGVQVKWIDDTSLYLEFPAGGEGAQRPTHEAVVAAVKALPFQATCLPLEPSGKRPNEVVE